MEIKIKSARRLLLIVIIAFICNLVEYKSLTVYADNSNIVVPGKVYEFDKKSSYDLSEAEDVIDTSTGVETYGTLSISGEVSGTTEKNGIPFYAVNKGTLSFSYLYDDALLIAPAEEIHLTEDDGKKVNGIALDDKIGYGAIILQTSKDGKIWYDVPNQSRTNVFKETTTEKKKFYEATNVQLVNGCYYRIIVAYETCIQTQKKQAIPPKLDKYEYKKVAEVYSFYACDENALNVQEPSKENRRNLGSKVRTIREGYTGEKEMNNDDPHFGWEIGQFFVGGYTDYEIDGDGNPIFLRNSGDDLSLWFELQQDINKCYGNSAIKVIKDQTGSDAHFQVPGGVNQTMDFGRGALIIQKTNSDNTKDKPQIFTNYLEASASIDSVTKVDLLEEGDYEAALDYAVKFDKTKLFGKSILPETAKYQVFFKFSVRNGNSMVFLKDLATGSEISSGAFTESGFKIDFANSQYLKVNVKREVLKDGYEGLTTDTRFNSSATNGDEFSDEGVYTITVTNQYNNTTTEKQVYVGTDNILKAYMVTGLPISEIKAKIALGATIESDGSIKQPEPEPEEKGASGDSSLSESSMEEILDESIEASSVDSLDESLKSDNENQDESVIENKAETLSTSQQSRSASPVLPIAIGAVCVVAVAFVLKTVRNKKK